MKRSLRLIATIGVLLTAVVIHAQEVRFTRVNTEKRISPIYQIAQDKLGFIWFVTSFNGLQRYDGRNVESFTRDQTNSGIEPINQTSCLYIDSLDKIWIGTMGAGLQKFDPVTNTFTDYRSTPLDPTTLSNDTITTILEDRPGILWIGTSKGLNRLNRKTGKFTRYLHDDKTSSSVSNNFISKIYTDRNRELWIASGDFFGDAKNQVNCGLNRFDGTTGKFILYQPITNEPKNSPGNLISSMYEDRSGNFWVGTRENRLYQFDRKAGIFTEFDNQQTHEEKPAPPRASKKDPSYDAITFITEDSQGAMWIGSALSGINRFDAVTKQLTNYGLIMDGQKRLPPKDTASGFNDMYALSAFSSQDGVLWIGTATGHLFKHNPFKITIPFYSIKQFGSCSFYCEPNGKILWIATFNGLLRRNLTDQTEKLFVNDPQNKNTLSTNMILGMRADESGKLWLGTMGGGLDHFDPRTGIFTHYRHDADNASSLVSDSINGLHLDWEKNVWAITDAGISKLDIKTGLFTNYRYDKNDSTTLSSPGGVFITEDKDHAIWAVLTYGANKLDMKTQKFHRYLFDGLITNICVDSKGIVWVGGNKGIYRYTKEKDKFEVFADKNSLVPINGVLGIIEDNNKDLWVNGAGFIARITADRKVIRKYRGLEGVKPNEMGWADNYKAKDGKIFLNHFTGYYAFDPVQIRDHNINPVIYISSFKVGDKDITPQVGGILTASLWKTDEIRLNYNQSTFSFEFYAIDYTSSGDENYFFMLENYDNKWRDIGGDHRAFLFNVPPGSYNFRLKVVNGGGSQAEKSIRIIISPPWWRTWWAYTIFVLLFVGAIWGFIYYRSRRLRRENRILEEKVVIRTHELQQQKEKVESTLTELKSTQAQLIHREKMASLGELTAGIAHEIQNPLNFVNNFSEVNTELIAEMKNELLTGNNDEAISIANDIEENEQKIIHHGKRADAIVKGMLQHSRVSTGQKELTDINALADEYLRLSFHGLRAKDKSFNVTLQTNFDNSIGKINIVPQDIGRVL